MKLFRYIITFSSFCMLLQENHAQTDNFNFYHLQTRTGLSQNDAISLIQDSRGFIWIGTNDGLNRYDGYSFRVFQHEPENRSSLSSNLVLRMDEDPDGNIWIGTVDGHISMFDRKCEIFKHLEKFTPTLFTYPNWSINTIKAEENNKIWIGSNSGLYLLYSDDKNRFPDRVKPVKLPSSQHQQNKTAVINHMVFDDQGEFWVGTATGLYLKKSPSPLDEPWDESFLQFRKSSDNRVNYILPLNNQILVAFSDGLYSLDRNEISRDNPTFIKLDHRNIGQMIIDHDKHLWAGTTKGVLLFSFDQEERDLSLIKHLTHDPRNPRSLGSDFVRSMLVDNDGSVWIGTKGGGVSVYASGRPLISHYTVTQNPGSIPARRVVGLFLDYAGNLWTGTEGGGLSLLPSAKVNDFATGFLHLDGQSSELSLTPVCFAEWCYNGKDTAVFYGQGGGMGSGLGLVSYNGKKMSHRILLPEIPHEVFSLSVINRDELWVGTYGFGIICIKFDHNREDFRIIRRLRNDPGNINSLPSNVIRSIMEDEEGNVWVGTSNGLSFLSHEEIQNENPRFRNLADQKENLSSTSSKYFIPLMQSSSGEIWAGTLGGGLTRVTTQADGVFNLDRFTTKDGLPNNSVKSIIEDNYGMIWISTNRGLTRLDPSNLQMRNFGLADGLQDLEFSEAVSTILPNGELIFGGVNGINVFDPSELVSKPDSIPVLFTELHILNQFVKTGELINGRPLLPMAISELEKIKMKYKENSFSIGFSDLQYFRTNRNFFRYRLLGFDDQWIVLGRGERSVKYTNVPMGRYTFQVAATNIDGIWDGTAIKELMLVIRPPWWQSALAFVIYGILFIGFLLLFRRYTLVAVEEKNQFAMERFKNEQMERLTKAKLNIFTNISHEFRSPLSLIVGPLEKLAATGKDMTDQTRQHYYNLMQRNSHLMLRLIDQLMDFRRLEEGKMPLRVSRFNLIRQISEMMEVFDELAKSKNISFEMLNESDDVEIWYDVDKLEKILYNLLSNAFKNVNEKGYVKIETTENTHEKDFVDVHVINSGPGIPDKNIGVIFERFKNFADPRSMNTSGTGIGLAFTKTLVELHHGKISVDSQPNMKTCFTVSIKKGKEHFSDKDLIKTPINAGNLSKIAYKHSSFFLQPKTGQLTDCNKDNQARLLVIEDNPELLYFMVDSLSANYQVNSAGNGMEGMELCLRIVPDLVVSDIIMPKMDGYEFCKQLKADDRLNHIPLILLTSKSTEESQIEGLKTGAEAYISKPFSMDVLEAQISSLLQERKRLRSYFSQNLDIEAPENGLTSIDLRFLKKLTKLIDENLSEPVLSVKYVAGEFGMNQAILNKKLKALTGLTTNNFIRNYRLKKAASLIEKNRYFVLDVAYEVGFNDVKYFRDCFKDYYKMTPTEYSKKFKES